MTLQITQDEAADEVLSTNAFALLCGMLLDQQFPMERAFAGPAKILDRFGTLDPATIADALPEEFAEVCAIPPAVHRFPGAMAARVQALAQHIVDRYDGETAALWSDVADGRTLLERVAALPGFGRQKSQIFVALLGKQLDVRPEGWQQAAGVYAEDGAHRSVADVRGPDSLQKVRAFKKEQKAAAKASADARTSG
ncbi:MAG: Fe-S cluster assembly protein HesB [Nocardioidaceae bacterium]|nr:Fe-S cluster assembly protein HesB [Nocardioidaceae bacterium]